MIRPLRNWVWVLASGVIAFALAIYLGANMANVAVWLLGVLLGIGLISEGVARSVSGDTPQSTNI